MPSQPITFLKGDKIGDETDYRDSLPVNMSAVVRPMFGVTGYMLQQPGLTQYGEGEGIDRGGIWNESLNNLNHYRVSGEYLIRVGINGTKTRLGSIPGQDTVSLPYSFNTQGIVADGRFWLYDTTTGFREVTDPDLGNPIDAVWINGYYFFTDGEFIYHSDITDESSIDPLKFATAEFMPDPSLGVAKTQDNRVMVFGRYSIEYFADTAQRNFAFTRIEQRALKAGIVGTHCKCELLGQHFIMGGRKEEGVSIHSVSVGTVTKVASREVDKIIGQYSEIELSTSVLEARVEDDYPFLIVHLPNETLLLNIKLLQTVGHDQAWSVLKTYITGNAPWRAKHGVFEPRLGKWIYGDKIDARLGILDETVATQYDEIVEWILFTPFIYVESASIDELEIETMPGHTDLDDASVAISLTYDGVTYGTEWFEMYGLPTDYGKRFILRRLGDVRDWVGIKLRGASRSRMGFHRAMLYYG